MGLRLERRLLERGGAAGSKDEGLTGTTVVDPADSPRQREHPEGPGRRSASWWSPHPVLSAIVVPADREPADDRKRSQHQQAARQDGVDGIKTGNTDEAGDCLLFSADFTVGTHTITLVGVVLGGDTHPELNSAIADLIDSVEPGFREVTLTEPGTVYGSYTTAWGQTARAVSAKAASVVVWSDTPVTGAASAKPVPLADKGDTVGSVDFAVGASTVSVPLVLDRTLSDPGFGWRLGNPGKLSG